MARFEKYSSSRTLLEPTTETVNAIEEAIRWAEQEVPQNLRRSMNELVFYMAMVNQGIARKMAYGPYDPSGRDTALAWRTPAEGIRRISQRYYLGWKIKSVGPAVWQLYNDSREAYFIEFGISRVGFGGERNVPAARIRRPVRKLSLRKTLEHMMTTMAYHRIWADIYANPRSRHRGAGFTQIVQGPAAGHSIFSAWGAPSAGGGSYSGPMLGTRLG
jgi:hypothetical protein